MTTEPMHTPPERADVRRPWSRSDRPIPRRVVQPLQALLEQEASSGVLLVAAAIVALAWSNAFPGSYRAFWSTTLAVRFSNTTIAETLRGWVNDGLMSLFFLIVALEIKREVVTGELRDLRAAALPVFAAIGGMVVPALLFVAVDGGSRGWGVAMPTDIAFALGILALGAPLAPTPVKVFLLTLAVVDDLGTIVVLAVAYQRGVSWRPALVAVWIVADRVHVRARTVYVVLAVALWVAFHEASITPTLAGVVVGLLTPARSFQRPAAVSAEAKRVADLTVDDPEPPDADAPEWLHLAALSREAVPPLASAERALLPWATWFALPVFALANAGVSLRGETLHQVLSHPVTAALLLARLVGKPLGILVGAGVGVAIGVARRPDGLSWGRIAAVSTAAAVPFAVSLYVADVAFADARQLELASAAVILVAAVAALVAFAVLRLTVGRRQSGDEPR